MKKITKETVLKQGDKSYPAIQTKNKCKNCNGDGWVFQSKGGQGGLTKECFSCKGIKTEQGLI